jgi:hypothetical protein
MGYFVLVLCDAAQSTITDNSTKNTRYVVPARRNECKKPSTFVHSKIRNINCADKEVTSILVADASIQLVVPEEIKPTFRTPCKCIDDGKVSSSI